VCNRRPTISVFWSSQGGDRARRDLVDTVKGSRRRSRSCARKSGIRWPVNHTSSTFKLELRRATADHRVPKAWAHIQWTRKGPHRQWTGRAIAEIFRSCPVAVEIIGNTPHDGPAGGEVSSETITQRPALCCGTGKVWHATCLVGGSLAGATILVPAQAAGSGSCFSFPEPAENLARRSVAGSLFRAGRTMARSGSGRTSGAPTR
jgi:hypothetical protein